MTRKIANLFLDIRISGLVSKLSVLKQSQINYATYEHTEALENPGFRAIRYPEMVQGHLFQIIDVKEGMNEHGLSGDIRSRTKLTYGIHIHICSLNGIYLPDHHHLAV